MAPWNAPGAPGRFQLLIDGEPLETVFGAERADWHWQNGGTVEIAGKQVVLTLHDLTGFEGRCDAVLFCADENFKPPGEPVELEAFRRKVMGLPAKPRDAGSFDLVVVGGGIAGICAAISAARYGLSVALVQDRPVLGGNNSSDVRVWLGGNTNLDPYNRIGNLVRELATEKKAHAGPENTAEIYEDEKRLELVRSEKNITLLLEHHVIQTETDGSAIAAVVAQEVRSGKRVRLAGRLFADCTGDGDVGFLAGADHDITRRGHMGPSNLWNAIDTEKPAPFPRCPWALDLSDRPFPGRAGHAAKWSGSGLDGLGQWFWESGFSWDPIRDVELMRDWNLRAMYGAWDALKNVDNLYLNHKLNWAAYITGKRESRRLFGDVILTEEDVTSGRQFEDGCFPCTWSLDLHYPDPNYQKGFEGREFISEAVFGDFKKPYWPPYRCLYSRNITNLFMAGRNISVTHEALGTVRVMRTTGMMGEIVGMAASICKKHDTDPRDVYQDHLDELKELMKRGTETSPVMSS